MKTFLVGMLYSGENEYAASVAALEQQSLRDWDLLRFENLPNKEAHDRLYQAFMQRADQYRFFLKLDADTVLRDAHSLDTLVGLLDIPERDTLIVDAHDWISDSLIPAGMQAYSNRVRWPVSPDMLMVDHSPRFPGHGHRQYLPPAPIAEHSPDPSPFQAFRYGVHRCLKAIQPDRRKKDVRRAVLHWSVLKNIWRAFSGAGEGGLPQARCPARRGGRAEWTGRSPQIARKLFGHLRAKSVRAVDAGLAAGPTQRPRDVVGLREH